MEQGDMSKVNRKKSGILVSHPRLQQLVEAAAALKVQCPFGLVVGFGLVEPDGWEQHWRIRLEGPAAVQFCWLVSSGEAEPAVVAAAAVLAAEEAAAPVVAVHPWALAAAATAWLAFDCPSPAGRNPGDPVWQPCCLVAKGGC